jgi:hypothetical protein
MKPTPAKPRIIIAHVEGSGTALARVIDTFVRGTIVSWLIPFGLLGSPGPTKQYCAPQAKLPKGFPPSLKSASRLNATLAGPEKAMPLVSTTND